MPFWCIDGALEHQKVKNYQKLKCTKNAHLINQIVDSLVKERAKRVDSIEKVGAKRVDSIVEERAKRVESLVIERASIVIQCLYQQRQ